MHRPLIQTFPVSFSNSMAGLDSDTRSPKLLPWNGVSFGHLKRLGKPFETTSIMRGYMIAI